MLTSVSLSLPSNPAHWTDSEISALLWLGSVPYPGFQPGSMWWIRANQQLKGHPFHPFSSHVLPEPQWYLGESQLSSKVKEFAMVGIALVGTT